MYIPVTYEQEFDDLWMHLKAKYPNKLFDLDGVGKQLDMSAFSKTFFSANVTADASIDANANVDDMSVIAYDKELPKPFFKMNSYYILWKELKKLYGLPTANQIVEEQLVGDLYINDFHGVAAGKPYSYHPHTVITVKDPTGNILYTTMEELYEILFESEAAKSCTPESTDIYPEGYQILDHGNRWVGLERVIKHKSHCGMRGIETRNGMTTLVTEDHPVILNSNDLPELARTRNAEAVNIGDRLYISDTLVPTGANEVSDDYAYFVGFMVGDGLYVVREGVNTNIRSARFELYQKNVVETKIYEVASRLFDNVSIYDKGRRLRCGRKEDVEKLLSTRQRSKNRKLPIDVLSWSPRALKNVLAGLIDTEGNVNPNGMITIRVTSFALVQQIRDLCVSLNLGKVRTRFISPSQSESGYTSNDVIYGVSFRLTDHEFEEYSVKVKENAAVIFREMQKDGRFEADDNRVYKNIVADPIEYVYDVTTETGHFYSHGMVQHNCFNYSTYDIMTKVLPMVKKVKSLPPKYLYSFKSQLEQFVTVASNSTLGASGVADLLIMMSYYVKNMLRDMKDAHFTFADEDAVWNYVKENLVSFIYTINQPMRGNQSPFTNISIYDDYFLDKLCADYIFPDGSTPDKELVKQIQILFLDIMNEELHRTPLTFPVTTACFSIDEDHNIQDFEFLKMIAQKNLKWAFINMYSGSSSTLSSCCRLRSEQQSEYFNSFGSGSSKIGSLGVCTINFPRLAIKYPLEEDFMEQLEIMVGHCAMVNNAKRSIVKKRIANGNEPLYHYEFMELSKQYSTVGVNGFYETIELLGQNILQPEGQALAVRILDKINETNKHYQDIYHAPHNVEQVPGENLSIKLAEKDRLMGYQDMYDLYSNQFIPLIANADLLDRVKLQGLFDSHFSGGSICHLNVETELTNPKDMEDLILMAAKQGVVYFAINYVLAECEEGHMSVSNGETCGICGKEIINKYTRVVGERIA